MGYKRLFLVLGIVNSILLIFAIATFFFHHENAHTASSYPAAKDHSSISGNTTSLPHPSYAPTDSSVFNFIFIVAALFSLIPFVIFLMIIQKKLRKYKKRQHELMHVNKNKDLFFSIISHDLKSPAQNLIALSELNCKYQNNPAETTNINQMIYTCSKKHYELLTNLLDWSKTQFTGYHLDTETCKVREVIEENITLQREGIREKMLNVINRIHPDLTLQINENMLHTVVRNILNNAIKFSRPEGKILFYCQKNKSHLRLFIADNGLGMSTETQKNLFNLTYIRSLRGTKKEVGSGIGLLICKEILEKLKGGIEVKSDGKNGTIFILTLPFK